MLRRTFISIFAWVGAMKVNPDNLRCPSCGYYEKIKQDVAERMGLQIKTEPGICHYNPPTVQGFARTENRGWCRFHTGLKKEKES